ncbi:MAG: hypothetical protein GZ090_02580 [Oxalobacteraceae bacterium]|nr:hypothetical protein [Oxalobacteraceae bacterium]
MAERIVSPREWLQTNDLDTHRLGTSYSFLFVLPYSQQSVEIAGHLDVSRLRPVVDKIFPFT